MSPERYDEYLARFAARDHTGVLSFWADRFEISFAGYVLRTPDELLRFYRFFHAHVRETVHPNTVLGTAQHLFVDCTVRLEAQRDLSAADLQAAGYKRLVPLAAGQVVEIPEIIHYHLDTQGRFVKAVCAVY